MKVSKMAWAALPLVWALAGCGGGSDGGAAPDPQPQPPVVPSADRIEPFDPSGTAKAQPAQPAVVTVATPQATRTVALGPLAQAKAAPVAMPGMPLQIGTARGVESTATAQATAALLAWQPTARGTQVAALRFVAEGAHGVRLGVWVQFLPPGAVLRFYGATAAGAVEVGTDELAALAERNARGGADERTAHTYWSPDFGGQETTLEVEIPANASPADVRLAVPSLSHFTVTPAAAEEAALRAKVGESGSCNLDVTCRPEYIDQSRSVARMLYVREDGQSFLCSGTLLNDAQSSGTPYFLSAHHCISTQAVASTLTTDWFYRSASCGSSAINPGATRLTGGATLLYASATTDVSFLRLNNPAPAGIVYAGSYFGGVPTGHGLTAIHHPLGDLQKVSQGTVQRYSICSGDRCTNSNDVNGTFLTLNWQEGVVEGGSSGSAVFIAIGPRRYVAGQLFGGTSSCTNPSGVDHYGRFDTSYRAAIKSWLNP